MTINVTKIQNSYSVRLNTYNPTPKFKVTVSAEVSQVAGSFSNLDDVDISGVSDNYVIAYDAALQKFVAVNPDEILTAAVTDPVSPGIPGTFVDQLDADLDNKIDLDAGNF